MQACKKYIKIETGPRGHKTSFHAQLSWAWNLSSKYILNGILIFISSINFLLSNAEQEKWLKLLVLNGILIIISSINFLLRNVEQEKWFISRISRINFTLNRAEHEKSFKTSGPGFDEQKQQDMYHTRLRLPFWGDSVWLNLSFGYSCAASQM